MNKFIPLIALFAAAPLWHGCGDGEKQMPPPVAATVAEAANPAQPAATPVAKPEAAPAAPAPVGETEELKIQFPAFDFTYSSLNSSIRNHWPTKHSFLDPAAVRKLAGTPIHVPKGTTNLAKGKPVTSSDSTPIIGELSMITDGEKDGTEGFEVELARGPQWVQIDLEKTASIHAIAVWHFHRYECVYRSVIIQISDDKEFKTGVTTVFNTDFNNDLKFGVGKDEPYVETNFGRVIPVAGVKGRYVRLWSNGNTRTAGNHYIEVEVHGIP